MPLRNFIKENFVLVVGLSLPALLVIVFLIASILPKAAATPPQYEMLFTTMQYSQKSHSDYSTDFFVKDGALMARVWKNDAPGISYARKVMAYNGKTQSVRELPYDLSRIENAGEKDMIVLPEFKDLKVSGSERSPDGYTFENMAYDSGPWPVTELFGGYSGRTPRLVKGSAVFQLPKNTSAPYSIYDIQFLGWIVPPQDAAP